MPAAAETLMGVMTRQQKKLGGGVRGLRRRLFTRTPLPRKEIIITNTLVHTTNRLQLGSCSWQRRSGRWHPGPHDAAVPPFLPLQSYVNVHVRACVQLLFPLGPGPEPEFQRCQLSSGGLKCAVMYLLSLLAALFCCP